ncbi:MAG: type II toxin-antitoxin system VapC family toxin [Acidobacteria bacterium]|nr:type II toxin-antitoxin system VapC family toxin [Acidobacteriota bacterium]
MRVITDTHALVWALASPKMLSRAARKVLTDSEVVASVANLWELLLKKSRPGALLTDPLPWWDKYVIRSGVAVLPIRSAHVMRLGKLPDVHNDPFDRILLAQAAAEGLALVSKDSKLSAYGIPLIW